MGSYSRRSVLKAMGVGAVGTATGGYVLTANSPRAAADTLAWVSDFETGDFSQWSWWGGGPPDAQHHDPGQLYGKMNVITACDPLADGVTPHGGQYFSRYEVVDNTNFHAKVYNTFTTRGYQNEAQEVSTYLGTYSSWYYIRTDYQTPGTATLGTWGQHLPIQDGPPRRRVGSTVVCRHGARCFLPRGTVRTVRRSPRSPRPIRTIPSVT